MVILLIGDSIIDNAYWNDVSAYTTAEYLRRMGYQVVDRSTKEITTEHFFRDSGGIRVSDRFYHP